MRNTDFNEFKTKSENRNVGHVSETGGIVYGTFRPECADVTRTVGSTRQE